MNNTKFPAEYNQEELGNPDEIYNPKYRFDSRGNLVLPITPYQRQTLKTSPGSKEVKIGMESDKDYPLNDPNTIRSGYLHVSTGIKTGKKGGWVTAMSGGDSTYPIRYYNESTGIAKFYVDNDGNVYLSGEIHADSGYIGGWLVSTHTITAQTGVCGLNSEVTGGVDWRFWSGDSTPGSSNFRVDDAGNLYAQTATIVGTISGRLTQTVANAINAQGHFIDDRLSTNSKEILGDFTFGASGALKITTDVNNGIWISPTGILAKSGGNPKFTLTAGGDATFAGTLDAASGTFGTITAGILTGTILRTSSSGQRVTMEGQFGLLPDKIGIYKIGGNETLQIYGGASYTIFSGALDVIPVSFQGPFGYNAFNIHETYIESRDIRPLGTSEYLGSNGSRWHTLYTNNICLSGVCKSSWPGAFTCSDLSSCNLTDLGTRAHGGLTGVTASQHHSSTSNALNITPTKCTANGTGTGSSSSFYGYNLGLSNGMVYKLNTAVAQIMTTKIIFHKPIRLDLLSSPPGAAASWQGYMYYDNSVVADICFSNGTNWYKVTASLR
jgi:hypothetical protein